MEDIILLSAGKKLAGFEKLPGHVLLYIIGIVIIYWFTVCHASSFKDGEERRKPPGSPVTLYRRGYQNTLRC
jgi:hypothetical protein